MPSSIKFAAFIATGTAMPGERKLTAGATDKKSRAPVWPGFEPGEDACRLSSPIAAGPAALLRGTRAADAANDGPNARTPRDEIGLNRSEGDPMLELLRQARQTVLFLRLAAIELRRAAEDAPDIAGRLHQIASKLEEDAGDLARAAED